MSDARVKGISRVLRKRKCEMIWRLITRMKGTTIGGFATVFGKLIDVLSRTVLDQHLLRHQVQSRSLR